MKGGKKWLGVLLLLFIIFGLSLSASSSVYAIDKDYSEFILRVRYAGTSDYVYTSALTYNDMVTNVLYLDGVDPIVNNISVPSNTNYIVASGKFNLVAQCGTFIGTLPYELVCPDNNSISPAIGNISVNGTVATSVNKSVNVYITDWYTSDSQGYTTQYRTFTYEYSFVISSPIPSTINRLAFFIGYEGRLQGTNGQNFIYFIEYDSNNKMTIDFTQDKNTAILQQQIQLQTIANNYLQQIANQATQEQDDREDISSQSTDNESSANSASTSVSNKFTTIFSLLTTLFGYLHNPPQSDCVIDGDMGNMDLGDIDLCELDPPPAVASIGSILMIGAVIPFAIMFIVKVINLIKGAIA